MSGKLSQYDHMTTEELAAVLRRDLEAGENSQLDTETLLYVMELYAQRAEKPPKTVEEAYQVFRKEYLSGGQAPEPQSCENGSTITENQLQSGYQYRRAFAAVSVTDSPSDFQTELFESIRRKYHTKQQIK